MSEEARLRGELERVLEALGVEGAEVQLERPRNPDHGDLATNLALTLAGRLKRPPREIAADITDRLDAGAAGVEDVSVAGPGFINFRFAQENVAARLEEILRAGDDYGAGADEDAEPVVVEWVSANPTGPLHAGHGRQAALGDVLCRLLEARGWTVHREFYYNDSGRQMELLARSVWARYQQALGEDVPFPEDGYHGGYVAELAEGLVAEEGERFRGDASSDARDVMRHYAVRLLRAEQDRDLNDFRVPFDEHYLESSLYETDRIEDVVERLRKTDLVYEREGAIWLRTTEFGDQKDRVMIRSNGQPTYFLPDVAYHLTKWERGYHRAINVQGSDHHGTVARVRAGVQALGLPAGYPEYVLHQMVRFVRGGEEVKLSKRAGSYTTLRELYEEVGVDVARYFFLMRKPEAHLVFDLDQALDQSEKNPVYKIQYAHARMCSIFAKAAVTEAGILDAEIPFDRLELDAELELVKELTGLPGVVESAARLRSPHLLCDYLEQTAGAVNSWYHAGNPNRNPEMAVLVDDDELRRARLALALGVRIVLRNGLALLGLTAPERMDREDAE